MAEVGILPSGYKEVVSTLETHKVQGLNWLSGPVTVSLKLATLRDGQQCYLGSVVGEHRELKKAADKLKGEHSKLAGDAFYNQLPTFLSSRGQNPHVFQVNNPNTDHKNIYYVKSSRHYRTYFIWDGSKDGVPVIIKVAACFKVGNKDECQETVLKVVAK